MCRIIARLCVLTFCCLFMPGAFAEETPKNPPEPNGNNCDYVNIYIHGDKSLPKVTDSGVVCEHGNLADIKKISPTEIRVILSQSLTYGPDCSITITYGDKPAPSTAVLRVQQNYCFKEAGDLHPNVISGPAEITHYESGSYGNNQPGQVWVIIK
ncbi:MAG TPA: hypothetical protein VH988_19605 [Thermoanaerobaculia bacterium]|jgi:hypothetical protein|nr:hypothetical protein [Thermoanaerobaculia bacterium]